MVKKNKKVPWYKKIKSPISIELSFEDGNFNIGASVDIGPFGIEVSTFDGGTFGLGIGVFDIEVEGDGSGNIGMLFDTFRMEVERVGCTYVKKTYFQDFLYHTEVQKIEGCKTDEEKEREKNNEAKDDEDINEDINEDDNEESEDEDNKEENNEEESEDEEEDEKEENEDEEEDEKEENEDEENEDEKENDKEEDDEKNDDKNNDDEKNKHKTWNDTLEFDIKYPSILDGIDVEKSPSCSRIQIEVPKKPLYIQGDQNEIVLALVSFIDIKKSRGFRYVESRYTNDYEFRHSGFTYYEYYKFYDIKRMIQVLSSKPFPLFLTSEKNENVKSVSYREPWHSIRYNENNNLFLFHFSSFAFFHDRLHVQSTCRNLQNTTNSSNDPTMSTSPPNIRTIEWYKNLYQTVDFTSTRAPVYYYIGGYYEVSLENGSFPYYRNHRRSIKVNNPNGKNSDYFFSYRLPFPVFFFGTRKDINRRLKEGYDNGTYNYDYDKYIKGRTNNNNSTGLERWKQLGLVEPNEGFYDSYTRTARLVFEIPQKPFDFDIIPPMETKECCFTPDDREALMFNQRALQDLSTALGVQPRPKSDTSQSQSEEDKAAAAKATVGFPLPVNDISNPKMISTFNGLKYSKKIEEHDEININNYRELLLEILKLIQNQSMGFGIPKLRARGFGVPKNAMEPTTDTSDDRAYDFVGIFARMFAAIIENGIPGPINLITKKGKEIIESQVYTNKEYFETLFALVAENLQVTRRNQITMIKLAQLNTTLHKISLITYRFVRHVLIPGLGIPFKRSANPDESVKHGQYNSYFTPFNFSNIIQKGFGGANSDEGIEMNPNFKPKTEDIDQTHDEANVPGNGYLSSVFFPGKTANLWMQIKALMKKST